MCIGDLYVLIDESQADGKPYYVKKSLNYHLGPTRCMMLDCINNIINKCSDSIVCNSDTLFNMFEEAKLHKYNFVQVDSTAGVA